MAGSRKRRDIALLEQEKKVQTFYGGVSLSTESPSLIRKTGINRAFMTARGVTDTVGITTAEPNEISMKKAASNVRGKKILLADSSKFGKAWYAKHTDLKDIDVIITDSDIKDERKQMILDDGLALYIV